MGFFGKLFGKGEEKETKVVIDLDSLPVRTAQISGRAKLEFTEKSDPQYREVDKMDLRYRREQRMDIEYLQETDEGEDRLIVEYAAELEYVVTDEDQYMDSVGGDDPTEALNEAFYVCITAVDEIRVKYIEGDSAEYARCILDRFNSDFGDWGLKGKKLVFSSLAPTEEYREYYEAYRKVWG